MSFRTASAILRGAWLIEPGFAKAHLPLIMGMLQGHQNADAFMSGSKMKAGAKADISIPHRVSLSGAKGSANDAPSELFGVTPHTSTERLPYNSIAIVDITGPILKYGDACTWGSVDYNDLLLRLANSNRVKGVILNFDTPGGQAAGTALLAQTIKDVSRVKPVLGICQDGIVASAGMWLASAVQEFYVTQVTDAVGSIGAYQTIADFSEAYKMEGIMVRDIYAPQSTHKNEEYREAVEKNNDTLIEEDLRFLVQDFINTVKRNRGPRLNLAAGDPFTGKMFNAPDALKIGLIDGIKSLTAVVKRMEQLIALRA